jgi:hypothetical protein
MWVWTQDDELVNLDHVEFVRVEQDEDERDFEVRAYPIQSDESADELFYTLAERDRVPLPIPCWRRWSRRSQPTPTSWT